MKVLVTGASGFVGSHVLPVLAAHGFELVVASRSPIHAGDLKWRRAPELGPEADWSPALDGVDAVVHLAGRAHIGREGHGEEDKFRRVNAEGTRRLAQQAATSRVRHFVFVSSCHAVAAESDEVISAETLPHPSSAYGRSKLAAEVAMRQELDGRASAWTILRPPAVYGRGHASNFSQLAKIVASGLPLPLASVRNRRSFLYVENLVDLIVTCLANPKAFGKTFLPSDGENLSTPELIRAIARANESVQCPVSGDSVSDKAFGHTSLVTRRSPRIFPFPESLLKVMARLPGLGALRKLTSSLYVDSEPIARDLGWTPPFTMEEGLRRTLGKRH